MPAPKKDFDKADELPFDATRRPTEEQTPRGAQTTRETGKPGAMPATKFEGHRDPAKVATEQRIRDAYQLGGVWYAADGSTLAPPEIQQAHRAMDAAAAEARRKALLGGVE